MPRKIRDLVKDLHEAGFEVVSGLQRVHIENLFIPAIRVQSP